VSSLAPISQAWAIISRPDVNYTDLNEPISDLPKVNFNCDSTGQTGQYRCSGEYTQFDVKGDYHLTFYALDTDGRASVPNSAITLTQTVGKNSGITAAPSVSRFSTEYNPLTGVVTLHDVEVDGEHYQAILTAQGEHFVITSASLTTQRFSRPSVFNPQQNQLIIPEVQVGKEYYLATLKLSNELFELTGAINLGNVTE